MPTHWQIECLKTRLTSLKQEISRVAEKDHPYHDPDTVYEALKEVIKTREAMLKDAVAEYPLGNPESERKLRETLFTIAESADEIAELFSNAERVDSARIPFEILRSLSWVASSLLNEECHAVVRLDSDYNYTILSCRREFEEKLWQREWSQAVAMTRSKHKEGSAKDLVFERAEQRPYTVLLLGFPSYDANSILLHALAAHELGHEIFFREQARVWAILDKAVKAATHKDHDLHIKLQEYARENIRVPSGAGITDDFDKSVDYIRTKLLEFLNEWMVEIFSDLYAANLIGPTFIAAFDKIELRPYRVDKSHPPGQLRRELVRQYLKDHLPHVIEDQVWENLFENDTHSKRVAEEDDPLAPLYSIGEEICKMCLNELSQHTKRIPSPLSDQDRLNQVILQTDLHFDNLAPPSVPLQMTGTDDDVSNFWLLIYAAWHYRFDGERFAKFTETYAQGNQIRAEEILSNLLLHALLAIEIRFLWERDSLERMAP